MAVPHHQLSAIGYLLLTLSLLVLGIGANDAHDAMPLHNLALVTHLFD
jgi:hypothetical protein